MSACNRCGDPGFDVEIAQEGTVLAQGTLCDTCFAAAEATLAELRVQFEELLAGGMSREEANTIMAARLEGSIPKA